MLGGEWQMELDECVSTAVVYSIKRSKVIDFCYSFDVFAHNDAEWACPKKHSLLNSSIRSKKISLFARTPTKQKLIDAAKRWEKTKERERYEDREKQTDTKHCRDGGWRACLLVADMLVQLQLASRYFCYFYWLWAFRLIERALSIRQQWENRYQISCTAIDDVDLIYRLRFDTHRIFRYFYEQFQFHIYARTVDSMHLNGRKYIYSRSENLARHKNWTNASLTLQYNTGRVNVMAGRQCWQIRRT